MENRFKRDYKLDCPRANMRANRDIVEFGVPGFGPCALVERSLYLNGWFYSVQCEQVNRYASGFKEVQDTSISEMQFFLRTFGCPGCLSREGDASLL